MDRLRVWIESRHSMSGESADGPFIINTRPPPLRTSNTYDDDETFSNVSLNLLSRYEGLGLSASETIMSTLVSPKQRSSYFDGLCIRLDRLPQLSKSMAELIQNIERSFGHDLRVMVDQDNNNCNKPSAPRHVSLSVQNPTITFGNQKEKKSSWFFFPDQSDPIAMKATATTAGGGFFRKKKIQNIDWKLAQAIERVDNLRLDGDESGVNMIRTPTTCNSSREQQQSNSSGCAYQPPSVVKF